LIKAPASSSKRPRCVIARPEPVPRPVPDLLGY
jgi:hypothetical protein